MTTIERLLAYRSFQYAELVTGFENSNNEVDGIMVMEAPDLELWGRKGLLILSSYYAFQNLTDKEIASFFTLAKKLNIAGFVMKVDRLITDIPSVIIASCHRNQIPLIKIDRRTSYEQILTEISNYIINHDAFVLQSYYDTHKKFLTLMMQQPGIPTILEVLKESIHAPVSLLEKVKNETMTTNENLSHYKIIRQQDLPFKNEMKFSHKKNTVEYSHFFPSKTFTQFIISIPSLSYEEYELVIHEFDNPIDDIDFMIIENAVAAIQIEIMKHYAIRQRNQSRLNEMASDLLHGRFSTNEAITETITQLQLSPDEPYFILLFSFEEKDGTVISDRLANQFTDSIVHYSRLAFPNSCYVTRKHKVIAIVPAKNISLDAIKEKAPALLKQLRENKVFRMFDLYTSVSNAYLLNDISIAYQQTFDTQKILHLMGEKNTVVTYQEMGIYQLFVETNNLHTIKRFVPEVIWTLNEENPELLETLYIFLNVNQNFSEASQKLSVHPKTVRYRVDRLQNSYSINFNSPEETLQYRIGIRLLKLLPKAKDKLTE